MRTIGFPISTKENENRRSIIPQDIAKLSYPDAVWIERGFGEVLGISDKEYQNVGAHIASKEQVLTQDIICDPKIGDASYLSQLKPNQIIFGWVHATQNRHITDIILQQHLTAYAWENMFEQGRHVFWFNNELAGEAAIMHAFQCYGCLPYGLTVAVIGNGNTARGAMRVLNMLGARVIQYTRKTEALLRKEIDQYDVVVNCILWDVTRKDHIVYKSDLARMKRGAMIVDVSCDRNGGIETSIPTSIEKPTYTVDDILHYVVDHTPSFFYKTFSYNNSKVIRPFVEDLTLEKENSILQNACVISDGKILDTQIILRQER